MKRSQLDQLDQDALLVLYAAGELSPEDRRKVEGMLAGDAQMAARADELAGAWRGFEEGMGEADERDRWPVDPRVAERRVGRMVREWALVRPEKPPTVVQKVVGLKYPWWMYPATAAAAVFLAFLVWWGHTPLRPGQDFPPAGAAGIVSAEVAEEDQLVEDLERSFTHPSHEGIREAEGELYALVQSAEASEEQVEQPEVNQ